MIPTETLPTNRARMRPLIARNAPRGLSDIRRPHDEHRCAAGTSGHHARTDHGQPRPRDDEPHHDQQASAEVRVDLTAGALGPAHLDEIGKLGDPGDERHESVGARRRRRDAPAYAERRDHDAPQRDSCSERGRDRDADRDEQDVGRRQREVARRERLTGEGNVRNQRAEHEEQSEADGHADQRGDGRFDRGDERHLARGCTHEAHRREPLLAARGRQPRSRVAMNMQHGEEQRQRADGQDDLEPVRVPTERSAAMAGRGVERGDLRRARDLRQLGRGVADDDDQRGRGRERRRPDRADLLPRKARAELGRGRRAQEPLECRRRVELARSGEMRDTGRDRRAGTGGRNIDPIDRLVLEVIGVERRPQRGRRSTALLVGGPTDAPLAPGPTPTGPFANCAVFSHAVRPFCALIAFMPGQHDEQETDTERDGRRPR